MNVTPSSTNIKVDPGASTKSSVDIINVGQGAFNVSVSSSPYHVDGLNYDPKFTQLPGTVDPSKWVHFITTTANTVEAQKLVTIDYTVDVPKGTAPGGYYAVIFAQTDITNKSGSGVATHGRVGDILYITVNGAVKTAGTATAIVLPTVITDDQVAIKTIVGNEGGLHFQTSVDTVVKDIFGKATFSFKANAYILPQTQRLLSTTWNPQASIGIYKIERSISLPHGPDQLKTQWVLIIKPWVIIVLIAIIILTVSMTIRNIKRSRNKRSL
jgi:hypothetical protein